MANNNKIKQSPKDKLSFIRKKLLPREVIDFQEKPKSYHIEQELKEARKTKPMLFYLVILFSFSGILFGIIYFINQYLENTYDEFQVTISEFNEVHLKDLLANHANVEGQLTTALKELEYLNKEKEEAIKMVNEVNNDNIKKINGQKITHEHRLQLLEKEEKALSVNIESIEQQFNDEVLFKKSNIQQFEELIKANKIKFKEEVSKAQAIVNNAKKLQNIKINYIKEKHQQEIDKLIELYNPTFTSKYIYTILKRKNRYKNKFKPTVNESSELINSKTLSHSLDALIQNKKNTDNSHILFLRLLEIPYTNSVVLALSKLFFLHKEIVIYYENLWNKLYKKFNYTETLLTSYREAFSSLENSERENGYIIDSKNNNNILLHFYDIFPIKENTEAIIFREDYEYIAKIKIRSVISPIEAQATLIDLEINQIIKPFDKILLLKEKDILLQDLSTPKNSDDISENQVHDKVKVEE